MFYVRDINAPPATEKKSREALAPPVNQGTGYSKSVITRPIDRDPAGTPASGLIDQPKPNSNDADLAKTSVATSHELPLLQGDSLLIKSARSRV